MRHTALLLWLMLSTSTATGGFTYLSQVRSGSCGVSAGPASDTDSFVSGDFSVLDRTISASAGHSPGKCCNSGGNSTVHHRSELNSDSMRIDLNGAFSAGAVNSSAAASLEQHFEVRFIWDGSEPIGLTGHITVEFCCDMAQGRGEVAILNASGVELHSWMVEPPVMTGGSATYNFLQPILLGAGEYTFRVLVTGSASVGGTTAGGSGSHDVDLTLATGAGSLCGPRWQSESAATAWPEVRTLLEWDADPGAPFSPQVVRAGPSGVSVGTVSRSLGGTVRALAAPADGRLFAGGDFNLNNSELLAHIVQYSPVSQSWFRVGQGVSGPVHAMAGMPSGDLIAVGAFTFAGSTTVNKVARWNGSAWFPVGTGLDGTAYAVTPLGGSRFVVGGDFMMAGSAPASRIARWDGSRWWAMNGGVNGTVRAISVAPSGDVIVGGTFTNAGGVPTLNVARWNSSGWAAMGSGIGGTVYSLSTLANGSLVAGGAFGPAGDQQAYAIARSNGTDWFPVTGGVNGTVFAVAELASGALAVGGSFETRSTPPISNYARWDDVVGCPVCDSLDFNRDSRFPDAQDIIDFILVFGGGGCPTSVCNDIDFNNDGLFPDAADIQTLIRVFAGGPCGV
jgi:hypothetical protein